MIYETIPSLVTATVHSLYQSSYVDLQEHATASLLKYIDSGTQLADIKLILAQLSLLVCVILVAFILFVSVQRRALKAQQTDAKEQLPGNDVSAGAVAPAGMLRDRWNEIVRHLDATHESQWKLAVIEADKIVDDALARAGYPGATFGDRLSNIQPGTLLSLDGVWWAHKIRNRLAHEIDYFLRYTEARQALGYYEAALTELQLL